MAASKAKVACEIYVLVDSEGEWVCGHDEGTLHERYAEEVGEIDGARGLRWVKVTVHVPLPVQLECEVTAGGDDQVATAEAK